MAHDIDKRVIEKIFLKNKIEKAISIKKIDIGFTNDVYLINHKFILKVCKNENNENNFKKKIFYYKLFKGKIPVPNLIFYDTSKKVLNKYFMVYHKIEGDNLYSKWHLLSNEERKKIIKQICMILKVINKTGKVPKKNWYKERYSNTKNLLEEVNNKKIISKAFINKIERFIDGNKNVLHKTKSGLVYWDVHFDNFLIKDKKIVGILDFENIEAMSLDYTLDSIRRMVYYPNIYASKSSEKFIKKKDYSQLLKWFNIFYPELFRFKDLDKRLDIYSIEHYLKLLPGWPNSKGLKKRLAKVVGFSI